MTSVHSSAVLRRLVLAMARGTAGRSSRIASATVPGAPRAVTASCTDCHPAQEFGDACAPGVRDAVVLAQASVVFGEAHGDATRFPSRLSNG